MYRVMIVDDEPLILAGISSLLDWEKHGCEIASKVTNGRQALVEFEKQQPDIVITDIKMPAMSGIEFIRQAREQGFDAAFILLTNLEEFGLAKEAMSLGVIDYLVKLELTAEALAGSLKNAISYCENHRRIQIINETDRQPLLEDRIRDYFQQLLLYQGEEGDLEVPPEVQEQFQEPVLILVNFNYPFKGFSSEFTRNDQKKVMTYAENILPEMMKRFFRHSCLIRWEQNSFIMVISTEGSTGYQESIRMLGEKIISVIKDYFEVSVSVAVSQIGNGVEEFPELLYQVICGLNYYYYDSSDPIIFYSSGCELDQRHSSNFNIGFLKKDLAAAIRQKDSERFLEITEQLAVLLEENKPIKVQAVNACSNLYYFITSFYENDDEIEFPYSVNIIGELNDFPSLHSIVEWLRWFGTQVAELLSRTKTTRSERIIELVRRYVTEHYKEKISLGQTAETLNISQGYLSSVFKKQTGSNFSEYVAEIKIEKAKELIATQQYMMYEVSDLLGFDNPYYFSKVFKKVTGYTPKEYEAASLARNIE